jgi:hypothetical protein
VVDEVPDYTLGYYGFAGVKSLAKGFLIFVCGVLLSYFKLFIGDEV